LTILTAVEEITGGKSINQAAKKCGMSRTLITNRLKENAGIRKRKK